VRLGWSLFAVPDRVCWDSRSAVRAVGSERLEHSFWWECVSIGSCWIRARPVPEGDRAGCANS
jgi:hypothetical protein